MVIRRVIAVFLCFLGLYVATSGGHLYSPDEEVMFRMTEALARRGSLAVEPMLDPEGRSFATRRGKDGKEYPQYGIGNSLFALPLYWIGDAVAHLVSPAKAEQLLGFRTVMYVPEREGQAGPALVRRFAVSFFGSIVGAATCALLWLFVFRLKIQEDAEANHAGADSRPLSADLVSAPSPAGAVNLGAAARVAWFVTIAYGAGTMALPHSRTFFSEPLATFFVLATLYVLFQQGTARVSACFLAGACYALALFTRLDSIVVAPAVGLYFILRTMEQSRRDLWHQQVSLREFSIVLSSRRFWTTAAVFAMGPLAFGVFQLSQNWIHFGSPFTSAYADQPEGIQFRTPLLAGLYGYFMSIGKSVFLFSPAIVFGLAGWREFGRRHPAVAFSLGIAVALLIVFHARWQNWAGGWCWGPRHIFMAHVLVLLPAVGYFANLTRVRRWLFAAVMPVAFGVQLYGASQNFIDFYILYYRTPETQPNAYVLYSNEDLTPVRAIAPINDSIYVPQNSQWYRYWEMWQLGYTDNLWLRLWNRARGIEPPIR